MSRRSLSLTDAVYEYLLDHSLREHPVLAELREKTAALEEADMQIAPEQGQFMGLLVKLLGVRRALEVGVFTGYSALSVALALPEDGVLVACDISREWTDVARPHWEAAGVASRIDLRLGPANDTLNGLIDAGEGGTYDFAFIDADKLGYDAYYERCLTLLRPGGLVVIDNVLRDGRVADESVDDEETVAMRRLNRKILSDDRVDMSMLPVADGLTLAQKR